MIGFCDQQFPLEGELLGSEDNSNSMGFYYKYGIWIDGSYIKFENINGWFMKLDFIGIGIIQYPNGKIKCFVTYNSDLLGNIVKIKFKKSKNKNLILIIILGKAELPSKFTQLQLYPAVDLKNAGDSIRVLFKKEVWKFKDFQHILE